jgi:CRP-like cAMP-binding protein
MNTVPIVQNTLLPVVKSSRMFRYLSEPEIIILLGACKQVIFDKDERIITERDPGDCLYLVLAGSARVTVEENGRDAYICTLGAGEVFGEAGLFLNLKRTANVAAADDGTTVLRVNRAEFMRFIREHPAAGIRVLFMIIYSLLAKLREANLELAYERRNDIAQEDIDDLLKEYLEPK